MGFYLAEFYFVDSRQFCEIHFFMRIFCWRKKIALLRKCIDILNAHFLFEKKYDIIEK